MRNPGTHDEFDPERLGPSHCRPDVLLHAVVAETCARHFQPTLLQQRVKFFEAESVIAAAFNLRKAEFLYLVERGRDIRLEGFAERVELQSQRTLEVPAQVGRWRGDTEEEQGDDKEFHKSRMLRHLNRQRKAPLRRELREKEGFRRDAAKA